MDNSLALTSAASQSPQNPSDSSYQCKPSLSNTQKAVIGTTVLVAALVLGYVLYSKNPFSSLIDEAEQKTREFYQGILAGTIGPGNAEGGSHFNQCTSQHKITKFDFSDRTAFAGSYYGHPLQKELDMLKAMHSQPLKGFGYKLTTASPDLFSFTSIKFVLEIETC